jgi:hypothetical protein
MAKKSADLGQCIDLLYTAREARLALGRELAALKAREDEAEKLVIEALDVQSLTGGKGTLASVTIIPKVVPKPDPEHWAEIFAWIAKTKNWALVRKQINSEPYRELLEGKVRVPHTETVTVFDLSIKKLAGKS